MKSRYILLLSAMICQSHAGANEIEGFKNPHVKTKLHVFGETKNSIESNIEQNSKFVSFMKALNAELQKCKGVPTNLQSMRISIKGIAKVELLESSGSKRIDREVLKHTKFALAKSLKWNADTRVTIAFKDKAIEVSTMSTIPNKSLIRNALVKKSTLVGKDAQIKE